MSESKRRRKKTVGVIHYSQSGTNMKKEQRKNGTEVEMEEHI